VATLRAHGIEARLPNAFEGRIFIRPRVANEVPFPVAHFATFALPGQVADFGGGAVTLMGPNDVFAVLFEYGPESIGTRLFARQGMPASSVLMTSAPICYGEVSGDSPAPNGSSPSPGAPSPSTPSLAAMSEGEPWFPTSTACFPICRSIRSLYR